MKTLPQYINEWLIKKKINKVAKHYEYTPQTKEELQSILKELIEKDETDFNCIDVSNITDMSYLFYNDSIRIIKDFDVSDWDISNVTTTEGMFGHCYGFTGKGLENWNFSNVKDMNAMFYYCYKFDCDVSNWDVSKCENMCQLFMKCHVFKGVGLENWNMESVINVSWMFYDCKEVKFDPFIWKMNKMVFGSNVFKNCKYIKKYPIWVK